MTPFLRPLAACIPVLFMACADAPTDEANPPADASIDPSDPTASPSASADSASAAPPSPSWPSSPFVGTWTATGGAGTEQCNDGETGALSPNPANTIEVTQTGPQTLFVFNVGTYLASGSCGVALTIAGNIARVAYAGQECPVADTDDVTDSYLAVTFTLPDEQGTSDDAAQGADDAGPASDDAGQKADDGGAPILDAGLDASDGATPLPMTMTLYEQDLAQGPVLGCTSTLTYSLQRTSP